MLMLRRLILSCLCAGSMHTSAAEIPEVLASCARQNLPESTSTQSIELRVMDRSHYEQVLEADIFLKRFADSRARVMMYFNEPVDIRGARFLIMENQPHNDMYIYMPGLFKVRRITSRNISSSVMGTDFSYEDFERIQGMLSNIRTEQLPDAELSGRPVYVLMGYPDETSGYTKIASYIDKDSCLPLKTEMYEHGDHLRKLMTIDPVDIRKAGAVSYPAELLMKDLRDKTETRLVVKNIHIDTEVDDNLFEPEQLKNTKVPPVNP